MMRARAVRAFGAFLFAMILSPAFLFAAEQPVLRWGADCDGGAPYIFRDPENPERLIGSYALLVMHNLAHRGTPSAIVEDVVVDVQHRSQGIGREMMAHAMAQARAAGCYKLALSSNVRRERAHAFYESLDFKRHGYSFVIDINTP